MAEIESGVSVPARLAGLELGHVVAIPAVRQVTLLIGVAASVAAGFAVFVWGQGPDYRTLYNGLTPATAAEVTSALTSAGIAHRLGVGGSSVQVDASALDQARLEMASQGLPGTSNPGLEVLKETSGFGVSQFMENARYQHALETELARTISTLRSVENARVHLAVPRQSGFVRNKEKASASVLLTLHRGRTLDNGQADAILRLVAGSIPNLPSSAVTVVDQHGSLLTGGSDSAFGAGKQQFEYARNLERIYRQRVLDLMTPIVGQGNVRAEVMADLDFTETSETRETYDPANSVVRSESTDERIQRAGAEVAAGIPGAISNQPPATGGIDAAAQQVAENDELMRDSSLTRNFEVDKTVSVSRAPIGTVRRLSVAVLIDESYDQPATTEGEADDAGAAAAPQPLDAATIERYTLLIREAIGFDENRGDTVSVISAPFVQAPVPAEAEALPIWKNPTILSIARQSIGVLAVIGIAFGLGRPLLRNLLSTQTPPPPRVQAATGEILPAGTGGPAMPAMVPATSGFNYEQKVAAARNITGHDPARVAEVLKKWVATDE